MASIFVSITAMRNDPNNVFEICLKSDNQSIAFVQHPYLLGMKFLIPCQDMETLSLNDMLKKKRHYNIKRHDINENINNKLQALFQQRELIEDLLNQAKADERQIQCKHRTKKAKTLHKEYTDSCTEQEKCIAEKNHSKFLETWDSQVNVEEEITRSYSHLHDELARFSTQESILGLEREEALKKLENDAKKAYEKYWKSGDSKMVVHNIPEKNVSHIIADNSSNIDHNTQLTFMIRRLAECVTIIIRHDNIDYEILMANDQVNARKICLNVIDGIVVFNYNLEQNVLYMKTSNKMDKAILFEHHGNNIFQTSLNNLSCITLVKK